jgi:hypothetical protein
MVRHNYFKYNIYLFLVDVMERKNNKLDWTMKEKEIRNQIGNVIRIMLEHSVTLQFIQAIKQSNGNSILRII